MRRAFTEGRQSGLLGQRRPGGLLRHSPSPVPAAANERPPTTASGPSNNTSDTVDAADGTEGRRREGGEEEEEPNCPVQ